MPYGLPDKNPVTVQVWWGLICSMDEIASAVDSLSSVNGCED